MSLILSIPTLAQQTVPVSTVLTQSPVRVDEKLVMELFNYEEYGYSRSKKTEIGDQLELSSRFRYQFTDNAWASLGFTTTPLENRFDNKTSDFELRTGYVYNRFVLQIDLNLNTNDGEGGITFGPDVESRNTFLSYTPFEKWQIIFYPFNFNGSTGVNLPNFNVTNLFFIDGAPNQLDTLQLRDEKLGRKTIPGLELFYSDLDNDFNGWSAYMGVGAATYLYPTDPDFDIRSNIGSLSWQRKEDVGYKLGAVYKDARQFSSLQYVTHTQSREVGSLLESSFNVYSLSRPLSKLIFEAEVSMSQAGEMPYRVDRRSNWFEVNEAISVDPRQRVYSDRQNNLQDWIGESGYGVSLKAGVPFFPQDRKDTTPYISYSYYSPHFVFDGRESAHRLRNRDESLGHGGLQKFGIGAYFYPGTFIINPRFEYLSARNPVFTNSSDIRNDSIAAVFNTYDYQFFISVSYFFDKRVGPRTFRLN
jgi:hypothetical protein